MRKYKSIMQHDDFCYLCGIGGWHDEHHVFNKFNKKRSEKYGLIIYLCRICHDIWHNGDQSIRRDIEKEAQKLWEERFGTREDFIAEFNKSYL